MRSTVSAWRQIAVSVALRPGAGGLRHASNSARTTCRAARRVWPPRNVVHAVARRRRVAVGVEQHRDAPPARLAGRESSRGLSGTRSSDRCRCSSPAPTASRRRRPVVYAFALQLDTSAPPIGAYTIAPPPGPVSVATAVPSHAIASPFVARRVGIRRGAQLEVVDRVRGDGLRAAARVRDLQQHHHRVAVVAERRRRSTTPSSRRRPRPPTGSCSTVDVADLARRAAAEPRRRAADLERRSTCRTRGCGGRCPRRRGSTGSPCRYRYGRSRYCFTAFALTSNTWKPNPLPVTRYRNDGTGSTASAGRAATGIAKVAARAVRARRSIAGRRFARSVPGGSRQSHSRTCVRSAGCETQPRRDPRGAIRDVRLRMLDDADVRCGGTCLEQARARCVSPSSPRRSSLPAAHRATARSTDADAADDAAGLRPMTTATRRRCGLARPTCDHAFRLEGHGSDSSRLADRHDFVQWAGEPAPVRSSSRSAATARGPATTRSTDGHPPVQVHRQRIELDSRSDESETQPTTAWVTRTTCSPASP